MNPSKWFPLWLFCFLISIFCGATPSDSLVRWSEISFSSAFEKTALHNFFKSNEKDYLLALLGNVSPGDENLAGLFEDKINVTLREIQGSDNLKKKNDKKVKYLYQVIHDRFLAKYEGESQFYEILKSGNYNCVTATALYALFFERLGIPYTIKEEPTHVYLVAYPNADNILIETTTPASGFTSFDTDFKTKYITALKSQKIIGSAEVKASNLDELFNKYYFGKENINLTQLIGIHYLNDGLFKREDKDIAGAYEQMEKGYLFYPNSRSEFLLMSFTAARLEDAKLDPIHRAALIGRISRFSNTVTVDMIKGEFYNLTQDVLTKSNDKDLYKRCYQETILNIANPVLAAEVSYIYYYENGRIYYNQGNYTRAKPFFAQAMRLQPNNVDLGGTFVSCLAQTFRNEHNNRSILDSLEIYKSRFTSLEQNNNFMSMMGLAYVIEFGNSFERGNVALGEKYEALFESLYESNKDLTLMNPDAVGKAYSDASVFYFKKGQKAKARELLEKGLQIVPNDYQLRRRKQMILGG